MGGKKTYQRQRLLGLLFMYLLVVFPRSSRCSIVILFRLVGTVGFVVVGSSLALLY